MLDVRRSQGAAEGGMADSDPPGTRDDGGRRK
jgi:hypothetical protein